MAPRACGSSLHTELCTLLSDCEQLWVTAASPFGTAELQNQTAAEIFSSTGDCLPRALVPLWLKAISGSRTCDRSKAPSVAHDLVHSNSQQLQHFHLPGTPSTLDSLVSALNSSHFPCSYLGKTHRSCSEFEGGEFCLCFFVFLLFFSSISPVFTSFTSNEMKVRVTSHYC